MTLFKRLGTTDEVLQCDCCGNTDLSHTVVLEHVPTGETVYFGCICADAACHPWAGLSAKYADFEPNDE
jgi:hypothetical protein